MSDNDESVSESRIEETSSIDESNLDASNVSDISAASESQNDASNSLLEQSSQKQSKSSFQAKLDQRRKRKSQILKKKKEEEASLVFAPVISPKNSQVPSISDITRQIDLMNYQWASTFPSYFTMNNRIQGPMADKAPKGAGFTFSGNQKPLSLPPSIEGNLNKESNQGTGRNSSQEYETRSYYSFTRKSKGVAESGMRKESAGHSGRSTQRNLKENRNFEENRSLNPPIKVDQGPRNYANPGTMNQNGLPMLPSHCKAPSSL